MTRRIIAGFILFFTLSALSVPYAQWRMAEEHGRRAERIHAAQKAHRDQQPSTLR